MQKILTAKEMSEVDKRTTEEYSIPSIVLMENAAHATVRVISEKLGGSVKDKSFLILCGKGNNGGDGAAVARILSMDSANVQTYLFGKVEETKGDARINFDALKRLSRQNENSLKFYECVDEIDGLVKNIESHKFDVVIDAVFGTGLTNPIREPFASNFEEIVRSLYKHQALAIKVSVDLPSGLNSDSSLEIGSNFSADLTVTFTAPKLANVLPPVSNLNGELYVVNIGSPKKLIDISSSSVFLTEKKDALSWLKQTRFLPDSYKNKRGNALLVVGSKKYSGAAVLAGNGAMQSGAGMVTVVTSDSASELVSKRVFPEVMVSGVAENSEGSISENALDQVQSLIKKADALAIGSGLNSDEETTRKFVRDIVEKRTSPVVIDADGLNSLSPFDLGGSDEMPLILTPHEGEFLRLLGTLDKESIKDRVGAVRDFAVKHKVILVLKGERTLIAEPSGKVVINPTGNTGLGKAGNGDNLTGIITGFIAQSVQAKVPIFDAVVAAVYVAGLAGDMAERKFGKRVMLASDVRDCLVDAYKEIRGV